MKRSLPLLLLLAAALALRLSLGALPNLTADEAVSYYYGRLPAAQNLLATFADRHPPCFYLLMMLVTRFTHSELGIRLPCILMALATLWFTFQLALLLLRSEAAALVVCALLAAFFTSWHFDTIARMYEPARLGSVAASYFLARILLRAPADKGTYVGFVIASLFGIWFLYFAGAMFIGHLVLIAMRGRHDRRLQYCAATVAALCLPLVWLLWRQLHTVPGEPPSLIYWKINLPLLYPYFLGLVAVAQAGWHVDTAGPALLLGGSVVTAALLYSQLLAWRAWRRDDPAASYLLAGLLLPYLLVLLAATGPLGLFNLRERYFFLIYPYATILLVYSATRLRWRVVRFAGLAVVLTINLGVAAAYHVDDYLWDYDMKPLVHHLQVLATPADTVLLDLRPAETLLFDYYLAPQDDPLTPYEGAIVLQEPHVLPRVIYFRDAGTLDQLLPQVPSEVLWLCMGRRQDAGFHDQPAIWALVTQRFDATDPPLSTTTTMGLYGDETTTLFKLRKRTRIAPPTTGMLGQREADGK